MSKVCHMTSAHGPEDERIFLKECISLARAGYEVYQVSQGKSYEKSGVRVVGVGELPAGRLKRMTSFAKKVYQTALALDADLYHLHDPELLPYGMKLKKKGKRVIFDSHEDMLMNLSEKAWIPKPLRGLTVRCYAWYEGRCLSKIDAAIGVTPHLCERLRTRCPRTEMITNYPILEGCPSPSFTGRRAVYPGMISPRNNIHILLEAMEKIPNATLELRSGTVEEPYGSSLQAMPGWAKVNFPGKISHEEVTELLRECSCGLVLPQPYATSNGALGTLGNSKLFEYMMAGIPFVCTDFILWKDIVDRWDCGICVDPENVDEIAAAVRYLLDHPEEARRMGENGRRAIEEEFNWSIEEKKLLALYKDILNET